MTGRETELTELQGFIASLDEDLVALRDRINTQELFLCDLFLTVGMGTPFYDAKVMNNLSCLQSLSHCILMLTILFPPSYSPRQQW